MSSDAADINGLTAFIRAAFSLMSISHLPFLTEFYRHAFPQKHMLTHLFYRNKRPGETAFSAFPAKTQFTEAPRREYF